MKWGRFFDELQVGEEFGGSLTVTEGHLTKGAALIDDFHPLHVDESFARKSRYGSRILHGVMTSAIMGGVVGTYFSGSALAYLEHAARFLAPVRIGDTLRSSWRITELTPKPAHQAGIVALTGECRNQDDVLVAEANGKMLVAVRAYFEGVH
jgi:acyl dehydratase